MSLFTLGVNKNFIQKYYNKTIHIFVEYVVHEAHECRRGIGKTKWNHHELIMVVLSFELNIMNVFIINSNLMIS